MQIIFATLRGRKWYLKDIGTDGAVYTLSSYEARKFHNGDTLRTMAWLRKQLSEREAQTVRYNDVDGPPVMLPQTAYTLAQIGPENFDPVSFHLVWAQCYFHQCALAVLGGFPIAALNYARSGAHDLDSAIGWASRDTDPDDGQGNLL